MTFIRTKEDFTCEHCGAKVRGSGYTNHCPNCLWSMHVDVDPGDRLATCGGMMKPVKIEGTTPNYTVVQRCEKCQHERRNRIEDKDSPDALIAIIKECAVRMKGTV